MKKKTHAEYVAEVAIKNSDIEVVDEYINTSTPITHRCLLHDIYWKSRPANILQGKGCKYCQKDKYRKSRTKTRDQYIKEISYKNPTVKIIGEYVDSKTKTLHHCLSHDIYWETAPSNVLQGKGCHICLKEKISNKLVKSHEQYIAELAAKNPFIETIDKYVNISTPIAHRCLIHDFVWKVAPHNVLYGGGCPKCKIEKLKQCFVKSNGEYIAEVAMVNSDIEVVGEYINAKTPILHRCKIDGCEWLCEPSNILYGRGCPQCKESNGERCVRLWLDNHGLLYIKEKVFNDCRDKKPLPFDFYLPSLNVAIEYQGQQHYYPIEPFGGQTAFELQQKHDQIKKEYCKNNNIKLLCIPYYSDVEEELNNFLFI